MTKYEVIVFQTVRNTVIVESESRDDAIAQGFDIILQGDSTKYKTESTGSRSVDAWVVNN